MASMYSNHDLQIRSDILESQLLLIRFLTADIMDALVHLFSEECCENRDKHITIAKLIKDERAHQKLADDVKILSYAYKNKTRDGSSNLLLNIYKHGKEFLHLTIHLSPNTLHPKDAGLLHFLKDIYTTKITSRKYERHYALIKVEQPHPDSLHFSIGDGYHTPGAKNAMIYDREVQQEMNVVITVLNRLFDSSDEYFVGKVRNDPIEIINRTNELLKNMNQHSKLATRKNKGKMMGPTWNNTPYVNVESIPNSVQHSMVSRSRKVNHRTTRKIAKKKTNNNQYNYLLYNGF
jgi:hypothetical protein